MLILCGFAIFRQDLMAFHLSNNCQCIDIPLLAFGNIGTKLNNLLLLLLLLPTLVKLFLYRWVWQIAASTADLLNCDSEKKLLDEIASLNGYLIAAVSICSSVLLLGFILLTRCASAIG